MERANDETPRVKFDEPDQGSVELHGIALPLAWIREFCRRHHIRRLALFGSIIRDDFGPKSDIGVLVEFEPGKTPGWEFFGLQEELSGVLGRSVDLDTPGFLSRYFRDEVQAKAV